MRFRTLACKPAKSSKDKKTLQERNENCVRISSTNKFSLFVACTMADLMVVWTAKTEADQPDSGFSTAIHMKIQYFFGINCHLDINKDISYNP